MILKIRSKVEPTIRRTDVHNHQEFIKAKLREMRLGISSNNLKQSI